MLRLSAVGISGLQAGEDVKTRADAQSVGLFQKRVRAPKPPKHS